MSRINKRTYELYGVRTYKIRETDRYKEDTLKLVTEFLIYTGFGWEWEDSDYYEPYE